MIFKTTSHGYSIDWVRLGNSNISKMVYDGVDFLEVCVEYYDYAWSVKITVQAVPENKLGIVPPIVMSAEFSKEFLEDFNINILDYDKVKKDPEKLLLNLITITSDFKCWSKQMNTLLSKHPKYTTAKNFNKVYQPAHNRADAYSSDKDDRIRELEEEIRDLKEEIELLKAVNQEC
jgi:hypothetical protein